MRLLSRLLVSNHKEIKNRKEKKLRKTPVKLTYILCLYISPTALQLEKYIKIIVLYKWVRRKYIEVYLLNYFKTLIEYTVLYHMQKK